MIHITVLNPKERLFEGEAESVVLPGDNGDFEILPFHKPIISLLRGGTIIVGSRQLKIRRGIARVIRDQVVALVEQ